MSEYLVDVNGSSVKINVDSDGSIKRVNGNSNNFRIKKISKELYTIEKNGNVTDALVVNENSDSIILLVKGQYFYVNPKTMLEKLSEEILSKSGIGSHIIDIISPMPGLILKLTANAGDSVKEGDHILVLEAMKMENIIKSPVNGIIKKIHKKQSDSVDKGDILVTIEQNAI